MGRYLIPLFFLAAPCHAAGPCAQTIGGLRALVADAAFPLTWRETSMDDGRPLVLSILEREGSLFLRFVKTEEGLWAEGVIAICAKGPALEARFTPERLRVGPAAHWAMRLVLANGADFTMTRPGGSQLRLATTGWSGTFVPRD